MFNEKKYERPLSPKCTVRESHHTRTGVCCECVWEVVCVSRVLLQVWCGSVCGVVWCGVCVDGVCGKSNARRSTPAAQQDVCRELPPSLSLFSSVSVCATLCLSVCVCRPSRVLLCVRVWCAHTGWGRETPTTPSVSRQLCSHAYVANHRARAHTSSLRTYTRTVCCGVGVCDAVSCEWCVQSVCLCFASLSAFLNPLGLC